MRDFDIKRRCPGQPLRLLFLQLLVISSPQDSRDTWARAPAHVRRVGIGVGAVFFALRRA